MSISEAYYRRKAELLEDTSICTENRSVYKDFFEKKEYKLKRTNGLPKLDEGCYKTLYQYLVRLQNVNKWFKNKPFKEITIEDIRRVYDGLEEGKIVTSRGTPFKDKLSYYNKIFRSDFFRMIGKEDLAREVLESGIGKQDLSVRFITEEDFRKLVSVVANPSHKALIWLAFDIGENVRSLLKLKKKDFKRQLDESTKVPEYRVNLPKAILKRTRLERSELTNYKETVDALDIILPEKKDDEEVFNFEYRMSVKFLERALEITKIKCTPKGEVPTWKDLRSSMACDLLVKGWNRDEINRRLGHKPSSAVIDKYINFLAIDGKKPQRKVYEHNLAKIQAEIEESKQREKLTQMRLESIQKENDYWRSKMALLERLEKMEKRGMLHK